MERIAQTRPLAAAFAALGAGVFVYAAGREAIPLGGALPDFLHAYALALLLALTLGRRFAGCAAWAAIAIGFELAQAAGTLPGTFDVADLGASLAGAAAAWLTLRGPGPAAPARAPTVALVGAFGVLGTLGSYAPPAEFDVDCYADRPPRILSSPPLSATVGQPYIYYVNAEHVCVPFICNSVDADVLPDGAVIDDFSDSVSWTPPPDAVNGNFTFAIHTEPDFCGDVARQRWTVHVYPAAAIQDFSANPAAVGPGGTSRLTGVFTGGVGSIDGFGAVASGVAVTTPPLNADTNFTLRVVNLANHTITRTLTVRMALPPQVTSFTGTPVIVTQGDAATLSWAATGDWTTARIDPGALDVFGQPNVVVHPGATTTYTLTLVNAAGASASATTSVTTAPPPVIDAFGATPATTTLHGSVSLLAQFHDGAGTFTRDDGAGFGAPQPIASNVPADSGGLTRATLIRLAVQNLAGTQVTRDLSVGVEGPGTFAATPGAPLRPMRWRHTATRLQDGRVFIAGDDAETELFDPATGTFSAGPVHPFALDDMATALLPDGRVLLVGGYLPDGTRVIEARAYDPDDNSTTQSLGSLPVIDLVLPEAVPLPDGRTLIVHTSLQQGSEAFDYRTDAFTNLPPLQWAHGCVRLAPLADGRVLVVDGNNSVLSEIFSPVTNQYTTTGAITHDRCYLSTATLQDGRVLVSGGATPDTPGELFDPATGTFTDTGNQHHGAGHGATSTTLADGTVLVVGGSVNVERFDPATGLFTATGGLVQSRTTHTATLLQDGRVLIVGGCRELPCPAELYTPP